MKRPLARAHAQDLQRQLDAAMARIRRVGRRAAAAEAKLATPELLAVQLNDRGGIWSNWKPVAGRSQLRAVVADQERSMTCVSSCQSRRPIAVTAHAKWDVELPADKDYSRWSSGGASRPRTKRPRCRMRRTATGRHRRMHSACRCRWRARRLSRPRLQIPATGRSHRLPTPA